MAHCSLVALRHVSHPLRCSYISKHRSPVRSRIHTLITSLRSPCLLHPSHRDVWPKKGSPKLEDEVPDPQPLLPHLASLGSWAFWRALAPGPLGSSSGSVTLELSPKVISYCCSSTVAIHFGQHAASKPPAKPKHEQCRRLEDPELS